MRTRCRGRVSRYPNRGRIFRPAQPVGDVIEHGFDRGVLENCAGCLRAAVAQHVLAAELERVDVQRARHHVGVALVGKSQLRHAEAAQCAGRRHVGVHRERVDPYVVDVVGTARGEAGFVRPNPESLRVAFVFKHLRF